MAEQLQKMHELTPNPRRSVPLPFDERSLGIFRIGLGISLFFNLYAHLSTGAFEAFYTSEGAVPMSLLTSPYRWSFLDAFQSAPLAMGAFSLIALVYAALTVGFLTRVTKWLSFICLLSIYHRNPFVDEAPDFALRLFLLWACLLPLGKRFSIDSQYFCSHRLLMESVCLIPPLGIRVQLSLIYLLNFLQKNGDGWISGEAMNRVLWDHLATPIAVAARGGFLCTHSSLFTLCALAIELFLGISILCSLRSHWAGRLSAIGIVILHSSFASLLYLGSFVPLFLAIATLFIPPNDWNRLKISESISTRVGSGIVRELPGTSMLVWILMIIAADNPVVPTKVKEIVRAFTPTCAFQLREITMIPQTWSLFSDPRPTVFSPIIETTNSDGDLINPVDGSKSDVHRMLLGVTPWSKAWMSYFIRVTRPSSSLLREHFANYLFRKGYSHVRVSSGFISIPQKCESQEAHIQVETLFVASLPIKLPLIKVGNSSSGPEVRVVTQDMRAYDGSRWPSGMTNFVEFSGSGRTVNFQFQMPRACKGSPILHITRAPDYGEFTVSVNEGIPTLVNFYYPFGVSTGTVSLPLTSLTIGSNILTISRSQSFNDYAGNRLGVNMIEISCDAR